jgi:hypothetical protein
MSLRMHFVRLFGDSKASAQQGNPPSFSSQLALADPASVWGLLRLSYLQCGSAISLFCVDTIKKLATPSKTRRSVTGADSYTAERRYSQACLSLASPPALLSPAQ